MLDLLGYHNGATVPDVAYGFTHPDRDTQDSPYALDRVDTWTAKEDPRLEELRALWTAQITIRRQSPEVTG
jgi:hypothetical protein